MRAVRKGYLNPLKKLNYPLIGFSAQCCFLVLPMGEVTLPSDTYQGQTEDKKGELERGTAKRRGVERTQLGRGHRWKETGGGGAR